MSSQRNVISVPSFASRNVTVIVATIHAGIDCDSVVPKSCHGVFIDRIATAPVCYRTIAKMLLEKLDSVTYDVSLLLK